MSCTVRQEEERVALANGEFFPGRAAASVSKPAAKQEDEAKEGERKEEEPPTPDPSPAAVSAYQKYYFFVQGPLVSPSVKFSEKKSIIGDDDDD